MRNTTDSDSTLMPVRSGTFAQAYNCQAEATRDSVLATGGTTQEPNDVGQCQPTMAAVAAVVRLFAQTRAAAGYACSCLAANHGDHALATLADPSTRRLAVHARKCAVRRGLVIVGLLFDAGPLSSDHITAGGPPRLIALGKDRDQHKTPPNPGQCLPPNLQAEPLGHMAHLLHTPDGTAAYRQRGPIGEQPFAQLKHNLDTPRTCGPDATNEWTLLRAAHNLAILTNRIRTGHAHTAEFAEQLHHAHASAA